MDLGFVGLGVMGRPMSRNLMRGGHRLHLHSRSGVPPQLVEAGGVACRNGREVAERSGVVFCIVPDVPDVERVLFGPDGVAEGLSPEKTFVDMSSISPKATRAFAGRLAGLGCHYLDAPVSGGDVGAREATLTIMVGGDQAAFERARPLFQLMGRNVTRVGESGAGQVCKVANQIAVALNIEAVAEALLFASKAGADPGKVRQALLGGFAASRVLEVHGLRMIERRFEPGGRVELHRKDLQNALDGARELGLSLPGTAMAAQLFDACIAAGGSRWDHSALVKALEALAGCEVGAAPLTPVLSPGTAVGEGVPPRRPHGS
ncbi:MAG TPA: 2-hydroxy-3-oxopropionate reductase [Anaeromyxobacteraceae bacterium]|nr:2-hydroxy-3-oxopropionate reductase [Anaeromyxobacteraceae bacterium]